jgi:hypothetical protein
MPASTCSKRTPSESHARSAARFFKMSQWANNDGSTIRASSGKPSRTYSLEKQVQTESAPTMRMWHKAGQSKVMCMKFLRCTAAPDRPERIRRESTNHPTEGGVTFASEARLRCVILNFFLFRRACKPSFRELHATDISVVIRNS